MNETGPAAGSNSESLRHINKVKWVAISGIAFQRGKMRLSKVNEPKSHR